MIQRCMRISFDWGICCKLKIININFIWNKIELDIDKMQLNLNLKPTQKYGFIRLSTNYAENVQKQTSVSTWIWYDNQQTCVCDCKWNADILGSGKVFHGIKRMPLNIINCFDVVEWFNTEHWTFSNYDYCFEFEMFSFSAIFNLDAQISGKNYKINSSLTIFFSSLLNNSSQFFFQKRDKNSKCTNRIIISKVGTHVFMCVNMILNGKRHFPLDILI